MSVPTPSERGQPRQPRLPRQTRTTRGRLRGLVAQRSSWTRGLTLALPVIVAVGHRPPADVPGPVLDGGRSYHAALRARHPSARGLGWLWLPACSGGSAVIVLLRDLLDGLVDEDVLVGLLGVSAVLTGLLRVLGGFAAERQFGRRWTIGGIVLGTLEIVLGGVLLLNTEVNADILVPVAAGWGLASGGLLLAEGFRLRRLARTWRADIPPG